MNIKATKVSREEENEIFDELRALEAAEELDLVRRKKLTDRLIMSVYPLIVKYAGQVKGTRAPFDDLTQAGVLGAMHALTKFDVSKGFRFSTYADAWIKDAIWKLAKQERTILSASGLTSADPEDTAKLDIRVAYPDGDVDDQHQLAGEGFDVDEALDLRKNVDKIYDWIASSDLTAQESLVLDKIYLENMSLADIGRELSLTRARIWQVHEKALGKIREHVEKELGV